MDPGPTSPEPYPFGVGRGGSAFPFVGHDAFDQVRIAFLIDEELPDAAGPGADVLEELVKALDAARDNAVTPSLVPSMMWIISP